MTLKINYKFCKKSVRSCVKLWYHIITNSVIRSLSASVLNLITVLVILPTVFFQFNLKMGKLKKKSTSSIPKSKTRREIRKEKRKNRKKKRIMEDSPCEQFRKVLPDNKRKSFNEADESTSDKQLKQREKDQKTFKKLKVEMRKQRKRQLREANEEEDKIIRDLEKKLKLKRRKSTSLPKSFISEGLDCILW